MTEYADQECFALAKDMRDLMVRVRESSKRNSLTLAQKIIIKDGFYLIEGMPNGNWVKPGTSEPENWKPYKLWVGDLWKCQGCGHTLVVGVGMNPIAEHYQPEFPRYVERLNVTYQVNDC